MSDLLDINFSDYTVLIVDDTPANLSVIAEYLGSQGFHICVAQDGISALNMLAHVHPDLILLDIMMPGMDGFETCRHLKENEQTKDIPVIFMTALADTESIVEGFNVGAVDYITKPFQQEEAKVRIINQLRIRKFAQIQAELIQMKEEKAKALSELNANKDKFFSILSHDLRTPFNGLMGHAEFITLYADNLTKEDLIETAETIYRSAKSAYDLLNNLLAWSRLQSNHMIYQPRLLNLGVLVQETIVLLQDTATNKQIELANKINHETTVYADENMLNTVIRNLTSNAIKFTPSGGRVTISTLPKNGNTMAVSVSDTGIGMQEADMAKLFRIGVHHTTLGTEQEEGTGLGLILCQEMVEKNGGKISVESAPNKGTTFTFTVPTTANNSHSS